MAGRSIYYLILSLSFAILNCLPTMSMAQSVKVAPEHTIVDPNFINIANMGFQIPDVDVSIGGDGSGINTITYTSSNYTTNWDVSLDFVYKSTGTTGNVNQGPILAKAYVGSTRFLFLIGGGSGPAGQTNMTAGSIYAGPYSEYNHNGETLSCTGASSQIYSNGTCTLTMKDGAFVTFNPMCSGMSPSHGYGEVICGVRAASTTKPDGEIITMVPNQTSQDTFKGTIYSSLGWMIRTSEPSTNQLERYALNMAVNYCPLTPINCTVDSRADF